MNPFKWLILLAAGAFAAWWLFFRTKPTAEQTRLNNYLKENSELQRLAGIVTDMMNRVLPPVSTTGTKPGTDAVIVPGQAALPQAQSWSLFPGGVAGGNDIPAGSPYDFASDPFGTAAPYDSYSKNQSTNEFNRLLALGL